MEKIRIGRDDSNDIVIDESNNHVSNFHAVIIKEDDGTYTYEDRSTNGSKINGQIVHKQTIKIEPGDEIILAGQYHLLWNEIDNPNCNKKTVIHVGGDSNANNNGNTSDQSENVQITNPSKDMVWDNRYRLVRKLGNGATAQVWEALDTKAGNIQVALKIFTAFGSIGTRGIQIFEKEFVSVHGMIQTNLLIPNNYDTFGNIPYLVSKYCQKGSAFDQIGRLDEDGLIRFMRDTAQGLDYLHTHDIVHQDIKPENILIDDDDNYVLTDFGISNQSNEKNMNGTPAYMGPERYSSNVSTPESDIWSYGATVFEMITGDVPFGDNGGMVQASGEKIPDFPEDFKNVKIKNLVTRCLDADPQKRPTAGEIIAELEDNDNRKKMWIVAAAVAAFIAVVSIVAVNHFRLKTVYYKDYAEYWGVPKGIHELSGNERKHKELCYKFEIKRGKVISISLVNHKNIIVRHNDSETINNRFSHAEYKYTDNGKLDLVEIFDEQGKMLYKLDYDENMKTATYRQCDELGTEMFLPANTTSTDFVKQNTWGDESSNIQRLTLEFDKDGLLTKKMYLAPGNKPAHDANNIYGIAYQYDEKGRQIEVTFLGKNNQITTNDNGLAIKQFAYDENDNLIEYRYLNPEKKAARDDNGAIVLKCGFDEYGNRTYEQYFTLEGEPSMRTDMNVHKLEYTHDPQTGLTIERLAYGTDLKPVCTSQGWVKTTVTYDENGFCIEVKFFDENDTPVVYSSDEEDAINFHRRSIINTPTGLAKEYCSYDSYGNPALDPDGVFKAIIEYDTVGNEVRRQFLDANGNFVKVDGDECQYELVYDEKNNLIKVIYEDADGKFANTKKGLAIQAIERDNYGRQTKLSFYDKTENLAEIDGWAYRTFEYDDFGNLKVVKWYKADGRLCETYSAIKTMEYDPNTNFWVKTTWADETGAITSEDYYEHDNIGKIIKKYTLDQNKQLDGVVVNYKYDTQNRETVRYATDLSGNRINFKDATHCEVRSEKYDQFNHCCVTSYWDVNGNPTTYKPGVHKYEQEFDHRGKVIHEISYGIDGNPAKIDDVEGKCVYDARGNMTELSVYDGYGKPSIGSDGFHKAIMTYDTKNRELTRSYYDTGNQPIVSKEFDFHQRKYTYDDNGNILTEEYYDDKSNPMIPSGKGFFKKQNTYDDKGHITKQEWFGTSDKEITLRYAKITSKYDNNGNIIVVEKYSTKQCEEVYKYTYNDKNQKTEEYQYDGSNNLYWKILYNEFEEIAERYQYEGKSKYTYKYVIIYAKDKSTPTREDVYEPSGKKIAFRNYMNGWGEYQIIQQKTSSNSWISVFRNTKWPYKWNSAYTLTKCNISGNNVTIWVKAVNMSKYDTDKEAGIKSEVSSIRSTLNSIGGGKPSNCTLRLYVIDKANRDWFSL